MGCTFVHAADFHLLAAPGALQHGVDAAVHLAQAVPQINALRPDCVVAGGDLAGDGSAAAYRRLQALLAPLEPPIHFLLGTYDDRAAFRRVFSPGEPVSDAPRWASIGLMGARLLLLDSAADGETAGRIDDRQLAWLDAELARHPAEPAWLFLHHPPLPLYQRWLDRIGLLDAEPFLEVVARHPRVAGIGYGHAHQVRRFRYGRVLCLGVPSLAFQYAPVGQERPAVVRGGPAFRHVELTPGGVRSRLHFLDGRVVPEPAVEAVPVYVR